MREGSSLEGRGEESEREREERAVSERESGLNAVGPKTVENTSTGQTGCHDRSDRSELNCPRFC